MTVTAEQWRAYGQQFVDQGYDYCINCDRCGGSCHCLDCSGMQCKISNGTGITRNLCTTSFVMAQQCWDLGLYMTAEEAEADDGPDVFYAVKGANLGRSDDGSRPNGASGHIVTVVRVRNKDGTTDGFYTIEAMGHAYGCDNGSYWGRDWSARYRIPGVDTKPPPPPVPPRRSERMAVQQPRKKPVGGAIAYADLAPDGGHVECWNGCSIDGDAPHATIPNLRVWRPTDPKAPLKFTRFGEYAPKHREDDPNTDRNEAYDGPLGIFVGDDRGASFIGIFS